MGGGAFASYVFHDVDLLPGRDLRETYLAAPRAGAPVHVARVWKGRYADDNTDYAGGIAAWSAADFERINGFPNNFWGWGGEDDEMLARAKAVWGEGFDMAAPRAGTIRDLEDMDLQAKLKVLKEHREWKCNVRWELKAEHKRTWQTNGLADLCYRVTRCTPIPPEPDAGAGAGAGAPLGADAWDAPCFAAKVTIDCMLNGGHWSDEKVAVDLN